MVDFNNSAIEAAAPPLDASALAELRSLDPDGKGQLVKRVLETYQGSLAKLGDQLRTALAAADWAVVARVAHTLKSSSASIGALGLSTLCAEIERLLRAGDTAAAQPYIDRFPSESARTGRAVAQALQQLEATAP